MGLTLGDVLNTAKGQASAAGIPTSASLPELATYLPGSGLPAEIVNDTQTGATYYESVKGVSNHLSIVKGTVQIDQQTADTLGQVTLQAVALGCAAVPVVGPAMAALVELVAILPHAGPGPGLCATDPPRVADPTNPTPEELRAWAHFTAWTDTFPAYDPGSADSFEAMANPILQQNWELGANCFSSLELPSPVLLAMLLAAWNARHAGAPRTLSRSGLCPKAFGLGPGFDPIANALQDAAWAIGTVKQGTTPSFGDTYTGPTNITSTLSVNTGPELPMPAPKPRMVTYGLSSRVTQAMGSEVKSSVFVPAGTPVFTKDNAAAPPAPTPPASAVTTTSTTKKIAIGGLILGALGLVARFLL